MDNAKYGKLAAGLIAAWFVFTLVASGLHVFRSDLGVRRSFRPSGAHTHRGIRGLVCCLERISAVHGISRSKYSHACAVLEDVGFAFLVLYVMPSCRAFLRCPGLGRCLHWSDRALRCAAARQSRAPQKLYLVASARNSGFVLAVTFAATAMLIDPHGIAPTALTVLPLSLIPTFGVPLLLILHIISIGQARRWPAQAHSRVGERVPSRAA